MSEHQQYPWVEKRTVLRGVVGSTAHGLHTDDGVDDRDEMGVCIEPLAAMIGQFEFEQFIYRTAAEREGRHDAPSKAGDLDLVVYSLRKWARLALHGNPTVLLLAYLPPELCVQRDAAGTHIQEQLGDAFVSREAGKRFLGYLTAQKQRLLGERGGKDVRRPDLVEKYGYDTKYAMHMCRLGVQGVEFLTQGRLTLPMPEPERSWLRGMRIGKVSLQEALTRAGELERELKDLIDTPRPGLREHGDSERVWKFVRRTYLEWWKSEDVMGTLHA